LNIEAYMLQVKAGDRKKATAATKVDLSHVLSNLLYH
jgi:hypothetical protein